MSAAVLDASGKAFTAKAQREKKGHEEKQANETLRPFFFLCAFAVNAVDGPTEVGA